MIRSTMGFKDGQGRARYKVSGAPDWQCFATPEEAKFAARQAHLGPNEPPAAPKALTSAQVAAMRGATFTQADVNRAAAMARAAERARIAAVFASEAVKGREQLAASLLAAPEGWPASAIVAQLPGVAVRLAASRHAAADAFWDRAYQHSGSPGTAGQASPMLADQGKAPGAGSAVADSWDRAWAKVDARKGVPA